MRWNRLPAVGVLLSLLILGNSAWGADQKPFDPEHGALLLQGAADGSELAAPALGTTVELRITGIVARAKVTQVFRNPTDEWLTGVYLFPLPDGAAVDTLRLTVGDRRMEGVVQEKEEAKRTLEAAGREGRKASLLEQLRPGLYTTSVANIGPGESVEVEIEMQQVVRWEQGRFALRFPMLAPPRYKPPVRPAAACPTEPEIPQPPVSAKPVNPFVFHVDLAPGFPLARVESPTHEVTVEADRKRLRWAVDLARGVEPADGDFLLEWTPAVGREPRAVYFVEEVDGERYALLMMMPPDDPGGAGAVADDLPREAIFVIDTSGSMSGTALIQAREALLLGLDRLRPGDWFNVIRFSDKASALFNASVPANPGTLEQARQFISQLEVDGGTEMMGALKLALRSGRAGLVQQVIFATDGQVSNESDILRALPGLLGEHRLFTVAIGSAPNVAFLRRAAEFGRGSLTHIASLDKVAEGMSGLFARLEAPLLRDIEVRWSDPAAETWPERMPDLYQGEPLVAASRLDEAGSVAVSGLRNGSSWQDELPAPAVVKGAGLDKLWAGRKIQGLLDRLQEGANAGEVREAVTELGVRHHLVTPYTSLVAVDVETTAPAGVEPATRMVQLNRPRGSADVITVTAESPRLDSRRISTGATVSQTGLEKIPTARDPWAILQSTPGVLTDRINVGGNENGQQSAAVGAAPEQTVWVVDGVAITDMSSLGASLSYLDFDAFEEVQVDTGDVTLEAPGARVSAVRPRGTNELRGSATLLWSGGSTGEEEGRLSGLRVGNVEVGGPASRDRFWIWGGAGRDEIDRIALGGQEELRARSTGSLRLDAQLTRSTSANLAASRSEAEASGAGAGPGRAPETTWDEDGREGRWSAEVTHIFSSSTYLTASGSGSDRTVRDVPREDGEVRIGVGGVATGGWPGLAEEQDSHEGRLQSQVFFNTGNVSHEVTLGVSRRDQDELRGLDAPGRMGIAGPVFGLVEDLAVAEVWRSGEARAATETFAAWTQDTLTFGSLAASLGLRLDRQDLGTAGGPRPSTLAPRLGLTRTPGPSRNTVLRASLARFAARLGAQAAWHLDPGAPALLRLLFTDSDSDLLLDPGEPVGLRLGEGIDPFRPGVDPDRVSPHLRPEITDEAVLGIERALRPDFVIGAQATWRRTRGLLDEQLLVRDTASGQVFAATSGDWVPAGRLTGVLPDGSAYDVPVWDLRPGLAWTGGTLLANGDRRRDDLGLTLSWQKRLADGWMSRGHVSWQEGRQRLGRGFQLFDDPTNTLGGEDDAGETVIRGSSGFARPHEMPRFLGSRWSFSMNALRELPRGFSLSAALNGREGSPLPWYRSIVRERAGVARVQLTERPDTFRASDVLTVDARLDKALTRGDARVLLSLEVFNLLGTRTVLARELDLGLGRGGNEDDVLAPRTLRLGLRIGWR